MSDSVVPQPALPGKPRLRGVSHQWAFFVSLALGVVLVLTAPSGRATAAAAVYAACVAILFGTSALYHRINWQSVSARRWMRRLDHSAIFLLIAGSYTPFALLVLDGTLADVILVVVWTGAIGGIVLKLVWIDAPKWLVALIYVAARLGGGGGHARAGRRARHHRGGDGRPRRRALHGWARSSTPAAAPTRCRPYSATTRCSTCW